MIADTITAEKTPPPPPPVPQEFKPYEWTLRYREENRIWGEEPSPPAKSLAKNLDSHSKIIEVGAGYARDATYLAEYGHSVSVFERSSAAYDLITDATRNLIDSGKISFTSGDFRKHSIRNAFYDAFFSHRTLHLLGNNGIVDAFTDAAGRTVKPGGLVVVTARDVSDFKEQQMRWLDKKAQIAEYRYDEIKALSNRRGQLLYFWNKTMMEQHFAEDFEPITIDVGQEIEARNNKDDSGQPIMTSYVLYVGQRRSQNRVRSFFIEKNNNTVGWNNGTDTRAPDTTSPKIS